MSGRSIFNFKRFTIDQTGCAMKVGTDGVLLGAWCRIDIDISSPVTPSERSDEDSLTSTHNKAILDIGTGTGLITLQLAQRTEGTSATIHAVEIDLEAYNAAKRNFAASEWLDRLTLHHASAQEFAQTTPNHFDHIVSNPPYFSDSLASPDKIRTLARHTTSLSYDDLIKCCFKLLKPEGRISLILPAGAETEKMIATAADRNFIPTRRTEVHTTPKSGSKRTLLEFMRRDHAQSNRMEYNIFTIEEPQGTFSDEYRALTQDFYLYF